MTHVLQLIRLVPTVIVAIADKVIGHTASVLAGELVLLARLVGAALLVTAVTAVITSITPDFRRQTTKHLLTLPDRLIIDVIYDICSNL